MQPTKKFIGLCQKAKAVQEVELLPEYDIIHISGGDVKKVSLSKFTLRDYREEFIFLPSTDWCLDKIKERMWNFDWDNPNWVVDISKPTGCGSYTHFKNPDLNTVTLIACEYLLSSGKNDLRKLKN